MIKENTKYIQIHQKKLTLQCQIHKTSYIIAFEGCDGVGKTHLIDLISKKFKNKNINKIIKIKYLYPEKHFSMREKFNFYERQHINIYKKNRKMLETSEKTLYLLDRSYITNIIYNYSFWVNRNNNHEIIKCITPNNILIIEAGFKNPKQNNIIIDKYRQLFFYSRNNHNDIIYFKNNKKTINKIDKIINEIFYQPFNSIIQQY